MHKETSDIISDGIRWISYGGEKHLSTINLMKGQTVYGEKLVKFDKQEYRTWDPFRSKFAAAIKKGLFEIPIKLNSKILYLGASTGTTISHLSDIVGNSGVIFAVESSIRVARELNENVSIKRQNIIPIIEDARKPSLYFSIFGSVDLVYCDIAQPDQTDIAIENCNMFLKKQGKILLVIKTRSIDVTKDPKFIISQEARKLEDNQFIIKQIITLDPFDKDHGLIYAEFQSTNS
ncbi:MAG: fibrillarin-like rRNA/tRNA 2'-O-methyltransferase [Nitrososphaeraceae archaeon]